LAAYNSLSADHGGNDHGSDPGGDLMADKTLNLRGLKCPLPALRTRKALGTMASGELLVIECTDPLTSIDIPNLLNQTGDTLEGTTRAKRILTFRIRKR
jgi:tRNA 2-thiouridine synthesizing protein A